MNDVTYIDCPYKMSKIEIEKVILYCWYHVCVRSTTGRLAKCILKMSSLLVTYYFIFQTQFNCQYLTIKVQTAKKKQLIQFN